MKKSIILLAFAAGAILIACKGSKSATASTATTTAATTTAVATTEKAKPSTATNSTKPAVKKHRRHHKAKGTAPAKSAAPKSNKQ